MTDAFLSLPPDSPSRTYSFLADADRSQPRFLYQQPLFCFRCEVAAFGADGSRPRPKGFTRVIISGSGVVGGLPAEGWDLEGQGGAQRKGAGLPVAC